MIEGIVISLKILVLGMGNRGSKSVIIDQLLKIARRLLIIVKEQRVDGSSVIF
jgi:hypothetical protein